MKQFLTRKPHPLLQPYVIQFWYQPCRREMHAQPEHVLPDGTLSLTLREDAPVDLLCEKESPNSFASLGGIRTRFYAKGGQPSGCLGCQVRPQGTRALLGIPASHLVDRHIALADLWSPREVAEVLDQVRNVLHADQKLDLFESFLLKRLRPLEVPELLLFSLQFLARNGSIRDWVKKSGYSHRYLKEFFRQWVGLTPKTWQRVRRMSRVSQLALQANLSWSDLALETGFSDQAHLTREFREIAGVTPTYFRQHATASRHVPIA